MEHFDITELVSPRIHNALGDRAWMIIPQYIRDMLDGLREDVGKPLYINTYSLSIGGHVYTQSGVRDWDYRRGSTYSLHKFGKAFDIKCPDLTPSELMGYVLKNPRGVTRVENPTYTPTWLHIDFAETHNKQVHVFKP